MSTSPDIASAPASGPDETGEFWDSWIKDMARQKAELDEELGLAGSPKAAPASAEVAEGVPEEDLDEGFDDEEAEDGEAEPVFDSLERWVNHYFLDVFRRNEGGENKWCRVWWRHAEAITRLDALWRTWESLRLDEQTGMSTWLRDHADHHVPLLMSQNGPFRLCQNGHREIKQLESQWAPDGWWDGDDEYE